MIATLRGIIRHKTPPILLIEVNGVGYEVYAPMTTFYALPETEEPVLLYTHLVVREDLHQLYGFCQQEERRLFRTLIKINGVGPKLALSILSGIELQQFLQAVNAEDASMLVKIPGIGRKTADRLIIECRDAFKNWSITTPACDNAKQDAIDALNALGYKPHDARQIIDKIYQAGDKAEALIRQALAQMVPGGGIA